ncbi:MAG: hypothetical protein K9J27_04185 [Bacteroidales bacterium]|nr:hypothetical protein [Bacteroidales bacterium]MCF8333724.1 hypothetical protein [Bacteroidales bacterium]
MIYFLRLFFLRGRRSWYLPLAGVILFLFLPLAGQAQVQMTLQQPPVKRLKVKDLWNLRVNNPQNMNRRVYLIATVKNQNTGNKVARIRTEAFSLSPGLKSLNPRQINVTQRDFTDPQAESVLKRTDNFPKGSYTIRIVMYNTTDDSKMAEAKLNHKVVNIYSSASKVIGADKKSFVSFYGNGYIEGHTANRQGTSQGIPKDYFRGDVNATLEIGVAPISFQGHYTTMNSDLRQSANQFTVTFDDQRFINNLRNRLTKVIKKETGLKKEKYTDAKNKLKKLKNIDRLLKDNSIEKELKELGDLESIKNKLKDVDLQNAMDRINNLKTDITNRATGLKYKAKKARLKTELKVNKEVTFTDKEKEKRRKAKVDSLQNALQDLEEKRKDVKQQNEEDLIKLKKLKKQKKKFEKLKKKKQKVENLLAKKDQIKRLIKQKDKLEKYKEKLKESGGLEAIQSFNLNKLQNKDVLKDELLKRGMLSGGEKMLYSIEELSAGTVYPYYSPLVLNGLRLTGVSFEWNPGIFYTAFSGGTSNRPRFSIQNGVADYKQRLIAGKIGLGKKHKSHIYFTALNAIDDRNSLERNDTINTPQSNFIFGTDVGLSLLDGNVKFQGEIAGSKYETDDEASNLILNNELSQQIPGFLEPNISTRFGLAYDVRGSIKMFKSNTVLSGFLRNIDPSYNSFGAPNLRTGIFTYKAELSQKLFSRNVTVSLFRKNESTTRLWQDGLTHYERQGGLFKLGFSDFPRLKVSYAESIQDKDSINNDMSELMISGSYSYKLGDLSMSNTVSYNRNQGSSSQTNGPNYSVSNYLFNQMVSFSFPLSLSVNINYVDEQNQQTESQILVSDLSASFQLFKKINVSLGGNYKTEADESTRFGGFMDVNYSFADYFTFQLSFDNNYYDDLAMAANDFNEYILNTKLSVRW